MQILDDLNPPQREAVTAVEGPLLILAGPGSGKTRVIAHRIAFLVGVAGVAPWRIASVTFTNKAAREMRQRVVAHLGDIANDVTLGTFHSICARLLRIEAEKAGVSRSFNIYADADQMALMKRVTDFLGIDTKRFKERMILGSISQAKSELIDAEDYGRSSRDYYTEIVSRAYVQYQGLLAENAALDFDDLIMKTVEMLRENDDVREKYQERYLHVLVDEFQDTNIAQYELARLLAAKHGNICVVGDPDQSIYSWRSADIRNIMNFERDFPGARIVLLEQNYRSTQTILDAAHAVISGSKLRKEKSLWSDNGAGEPIVAYEAYDEREEGDFIANEIASLTREAHALGEMAVMYRTNAQSRAIEEALISAGIRYQLVGGTRFYERREVKDILAYLRLVQNAFDMVSFTRVVNVPGRGIGAKTIAELERWAHGLNVPLYTALQVMAEQEQSRAQASRIDRIGIARHDELAATASRAARHPIGARQAKTLVEFLGMIDHLMDVAEKNNLSTLLDAVLEQTGYRRYLYDEFEQDEADERWANIGELQNVAAGYDGLAPGHALVAFLEDVALISDADTIEESEGGRDERVTLITLHSAKGLEYRVVFMTAMEEGVLPHIRSFDDPSQMEEERRLCYVGMTRAKERLYLLRAFRRYQMGSSQHAPPSRFLRDVPQQLLAQRSAVRDEADAAERGPQRFREAAFARREERAAATTADALTFTGGEKVRHPRFGEGIIVACETKGDDQEITIAFKGGVGMKKIMRSFTNLEVL
ncbi:MAG: UvrD-helicase domain-containing protein [Chloroflexota bacterium]|nr:UvrD-helicase domain-containing protein [Chloroflexota bacterium]